MSFVVPGVLATDVRRFAVREQVGRFVGFGVEAGAGPLPYLVDRVTPERLEELRPLLQIDLRPRIDGCDGCHVQNAPL